LVLYNESSDGIGKLYHTFVYK